MPRFFPPFLPYKYKACLAWTYPYPYSVHSRLSPSDCLLGVTAYTYMSASRAWKTRLLGASGGGGSTAWSSLSTLNFLLHSAECIAWSTSLGAK